MAFKTELDDDAGPLAKAIVALANLDTITYVRDNNFEFAAIILMCQAICRNGEHYDYD